MAKSKFNEMDFSISIDDGKSEEIGQISQQPDKLTAMLDIENEKDGLHTFSNFPDSAVDDDNTVETDETALLKKKKNPAWSFAFYQEFFDIDTNLVLIRIRSSLIPHFNYSLNTTHVKDRPDMYGPFWICATLVICVGVLSNLTKLISNFTNPEYHYQPQFQLLPIATTIIYCYTFILPLLIKIFFWWRENAVGLAVSQIICIYGYSLFVLIPASILFLVPYDVFDWIVVAVVICLSGSVIMVSLWPAFNNDSKKLAALILLVLFGLHAMMVVLLKLFFFSHNVKQTANNNFITSFTKAVSTSAVV